jgi:hypothetical protein
LVNKLTVNWIPSWQAIAKKFAEYAEELTVKAFLVKLDVDHNA